MDAVSLSLDIRFPLSSLELYRVLAWLFELVAGAVCDTKTSCLPQSHRDAVYTVAALHQWPVNIPQEDVRCVLTARDWIDKIIHPESPGGPLPCVSGILSSVQIALNQCHSSSYPVLIRTLSAEYMGRTSTALSPSSSTLIQTTSSDTACGQQRAIEAIFSHQQRSATRILRFQTSSKRTGKSKMTG